MAAEIGVRITGLNELKAALRGLSPKLRRQALRNALAAGARVYRDDARRRAPVLAAPVIRRGQVARKPGTLRNAIRTRTSKISRKSGDVGVFVNVVPAKGAKFKTVRGTALAGLIKTRSRVQTRKSQRGRYSPNDPFYWRFQEFGTKKQAARPFLRPAADSKGAEALASFSRTLGPAIQRLNTKGAR
ncbi:MAG: HK97-gp10 family putative phage morphogenesis protein [Pseudomonadota bacterium]